METDLKRVHIELTSKCNLKCVHCTLQTQNYDAQGKELSAELVEKVIEELFEKYKNLRVNLQGVGEPSLHPEFIYLIKFISDKGYVVETTSNLLAASKESYKQLFDNGLDRLAISIDSLDEDLIKKTRAGTKVKILLENIEYLANLYSSKIKIQTVVSNLNIEHIDLIYDFLKKIGLKNWQLIYLNNHDGSEGISSENKILLTSKLTNYSDMNILYPQEPAEQICPQPFNTLHINSLGYVMPCCVYWDNNIINFGNINKENIHDIFNSKEFNMFRESVNMKKSDICKGCMLFKVL